MIEEQLLRTLSTIPAKFTEAYEESRLVEFLSYFSAVIGETRSFPDKSRLSLVASQVIKDVQSMTEYFLAMDRIYEEGTSEMSSIDEIIVIKIKIFER